MEQSSEPAEKVQGDWLIVGAWEGETPPTLGGGLETSLGAVVARLCESGDFEGKANETLALFEPAGIAAKRVLLVGLGKREAAGPMTVSRAAGSAIRAIAKKKHERVVCTLLGEGATNLSFEERAVATLTGAIIGESGQDLYRTKKNRKAAEVIVLAHPVDETILARATAVGEAVCLAAELVNLPPADIFPETFCQRAKALAEPLRMKTESFDAAALAREKMECILGVGKGSSHEPRLLILRYEGAPSDSRKLALVGKGITFDSGGLSIKTAEGMTSMKCDMAGAAAVLAATIAIAKLRLPVNILCIAPLAENMPSGLSIKPGDVLRAKNGKTIEVLNTDAEGRLVLADALSHAVDLGATHIVDLATLTGACMVALGMSVAGVMSNNEVWSREVQDAAKQTGERVWPLPMFEEYDELIKSGVADMKNIGGRWGGAITAAKLLANFVGTTPWVHVDIAGPAFAEKECPYQDGGGTGFFVRSLVALAERYAKSEK